MKGSFDRNFWLNVAEGSLFMAGATLFSLQVILPAWLTQLGASPLVIGVLPVLWFVGSALPQSAGAEYAKAFPTRKQLSMRLGAFQRLPWLALMIWIVWGPSSPAGFVAATFLAVAVFVTLSGFLTPIWMQWLARVTPPAHRGRLHGLRLLFGGLLSVGTAAAARLVLARAPFPENYAWLFGLGFLFICGSWGMFAFTTPDAPAPVMPRRPLSGVFSELTGVITRDPPFRRLLIAAFAVQWVVWMPLAFFTSYGLQEGVIGPADVGTAAAVVAGAQMLWSPILGWWADHRGNRSLLTWACVTAGVAGLAACGARSHVVWLFVAMISSSGALTAIMIAFSNLPLEYAPPHGEGVYVAVWNQYLAIAGAAGPFVGGLLAERAGYRTLFVVCAALSLLAGVGAFRMKSAATARP